MGLTPRAKQILCVMLQEEQILSVQVLADRVGVSKRTVQRELEYLNTGLREYQIQFMSKTGVGVWLEGNRENKDRLYGELIHEDSYDMGNREDRRKRLILEILKDQGLKKLYYYSSKFKVSEATISGDLEAVEEWLNRYQLHVVRKPGSGVSIEGSETGYRRAIRAFIDENMDTKLLQEAYEREETFSQATESIRRSNMGQLLNDDILKRVVGCILGLRDERVMNLTENSYMGLVIHITIAINRISKHELVEPGTGWEQQPGQAPDEDYALALRIVDALEQEFEIEIPSAEVAYICLHIKGAKHEKIEWGTQKTVALENRELQQLVNQMIDTFDPQNAFLLKQDDEFIQGLLAHLQPTFIRLLHDMQITNPVLETVRQDYPEIYESCVGVAKILEEWIGKPVPEAEVGFLTVHFGAAMVRLEGRQEELRPVHMGVICSSGIGISRLMSTKLEKAFRERVVITTYGKKDITPYQAAKLDFFVSSIPIEEPEAPVIFVNPLLSETDMEQVRQMVYKYERMPVKQQAGNSFSLQLEEINLVAAQINLVIKYMEFFKVDNGIRFDELLLVIGEKLSPYRDRGTMIQEDLRRREKIASQIFAEFGFALLHTRSRGVVRPSFTVCMTKDLKPFTDPYFKGIWAVLIMLVPEDGNLRVNTEILGHISSILVEDYTFLDTVRTGNREAIQNALSRNLKDFFTKYLNRIQSR